MTGDAELMTGVPRPLVYFLLGLSPLAYFFTGVEGGGALGRDVCELRNCKELFALKCLKI